MLVAPLKKINHPAAAATTSLRNMQNKTLLTSSFSQLAINIHTFLKIYVFGTSWLLAGGKLLVSCGYKREEMWQSGPVSIQTISYILANKI